MGRYVDGERQSADSGSCLSRVAVAYRSSRSSRSATCSVLAELSSNGRLIMGKAGFSRMRKCRLAHSAPYATWTVVPMDPFQYTAHAPAMLKSSRNGTRLLAPASN